MLEHIVASGKGSCAARSFADDILSDIAVLVGLDVSLQIRFQTKTHGTATDFALEAVLVRTVNVRTVFRQQNEGFWAGLCHLLQFTFALESLVASWVVAL